MADLETPAEAPRRRSFAANLCVILGSFLLLTAVSLPVLLSFDLWIFEDRASFLHLDELVANHHHLGVDVFYSYGLLPVLLQHVVYVAFGRSFRPMIGCTLVVLVLNAVFWAALLEHLPPRRRWLAAVVALSPLVLTVNPNWPYSLAVLSILFALLFVLKERHALALAVSAAGCFCVPSLTLVLTVLIACLIVVDWWLGPERKLGRLAALLAPGVLVYSALAVLLGSVFSYASLVATAIPLAGARFYREIGYSGFDAFLTFLHPAGYGMKYYLAYYTGSPVTWFVLCSIFLFGYSLSSLGPLLKGRRLTAPVSYVVLYAVLQFVFIFFVYGSRGQHTIFECVIASAVLVGISTLREPRRRNIALAVFVAIGVLGETGSLFKTVTAWRTTARSPETLGLYAEPGWGDELAGIVKNSQSHKTLVLGYATGIHNYFPTLEDPDAWCMQKGQLFPGQKQAIVDQINRADVVVEVLRSPSPALTADPKMQAALDAVPVTGSEVYFRIRTRAPIP